VEKVDMRHKRLLVSEDVIAEIQVSLDKLELDLQRHNMGRDIAPDSLLLEAKVNGLKGMIKQWNT
jgi:hypothetical protein